MSQTDHQLLTRYATQRAEDAFAEVVRRHVDLVHSAALRQVRSPELAEEVAQAVFIELARQARHLPPGTVLAAWLYHVTRRRAIDLVRREAGRRLREQTAQQLQVMNATAEDWTHIEPLLDDAMDALEETDRLAVLLRYFQNKPLREVGQAIGGTEDAAQKRVSRAVERLREFFAKRGVTVGTSGLVVVVSANAVQSAPAGLALTISTAVAVAGTTAAAAALTAATKTVAMTTLQKTLIAATLAVATLIGIYEASRASALRKTINTLRQQQTALSEEANRDCDEAARQLAGLRAENERLKRGTAELVRLRGEVSRLRQDLAAASRRVARVDAAASTNEAKPAPEPVRLFEANAQVTVPSGQTLVLGGWTTAPGKLTLVFVKPNILELSSADRIGSIMLECRFIELSEEVLAKAASEVSLASLNKKIDGEESFTPGLFSEKNAAQILAILEADARTSVVGAPRIQTGDGISAIMSATEQKVVEGREYPLGLSLEVAPSIGADGSSVKLNVTARLNAVNPDQQTAPRRL